MTRIGFFPITGDPIHKGHLAAAMSAQMNLKLDAVYIQLCGDSEYKPFKVDKKHRHEMAKRAIQEKAPALQYTPLGYDSTLLGEDLFIEFVKQPPIENIEEFMFLAGYGNKEIVLEAFQLNKSRLGKVVYEIAFLTNNENDLNNKNETHQIIYFTPFYSSTSYRNHECTDIVPKVVYDYCVEHHLYGY